MSTMIFDRLLAGYRKPPRPRPSVRVAWLRENRKVSNFWHWPALALLCAVSLSSGHVQFMEHRAELLVQGVVWATIWEQGSLMPSMFFIPLAVDVFTAQSTADEHEGRSRQCMSVSGLAGIMVASKLLHTAQTALMSVLVFLTGLIVTGLLLGLDPTKLGPYLTCVVPIALSVWVIKVFVMWVGTIANSSAVIMSILLLTTIGGSVPSLVAPPVAGLYPLSLITSTFASRQPDSIASMGSMLVTGSTATVWAALWASMLLRKIVHDP